VCYVDVDSTKQWVQVQANSALEGSILARLGALESQSIAYGTMSPNYVINGGFDIWQRGTSFVDPNSTASFNADRFIGFRGSLVTGMTVTRQSAGLNGFNYCARIQRTSGNTSTQLLYFNANTIETINTIPLQNKTVTFSFYARVGANYSGGSTLTATLTSGTGTDQNIVSFTGPVIVATGSASVTTSWQRFSFSGAFPSNGSEAKIEWSYVPTGTAGANDWFEITGVQLEVGSVATSFRRNAPSIQAELAACQRYYQRTTTTSAYGGVASGVAINTTTVYAHYLPKVSMRIVPTAVEFSTASTLRIGGTTCTNVFLNASDSSLDTISIGFTVTSGLTNGAYYPISGNNNAAAYVGVSAEL
jgi:hypothetical protein